jgi:hypothetical protein
MGDPALETFLASKNGSLAWLEAIDSQKKMDNYGNKKCRFGINCAISEQLSL